MQVSSLMRWETTQRAMRHAARVLRPAAGVLAVVLLVGFRAAPEHRYARRTAVCVGINRYAGFPDLACAENDARAVARVLKDYGFDRVIALTGASATRRGILAALEDAGKGLDRGDLLVVYFAGHGWTGRQGTTATGYLLPADTRRGRETRDGIAMSVLDRHSGATACHSLFLVDACYAGLGIGTVPASPAPPRTVQVLTAGGALDRAFESDGHGLFTRHLLDYLRAATHKDAGVATPELARYVTARVKHETAGWQAPRFGGRGRILITPR